MVALSGHDVTRNDYGYYNVRLSGQVLPEDAAFDGNETRRSPSRPAVGRHRVVERFDYRFDLPGERRRRTHAAPLALVFENDLRPGRYLVELEIEDLAAGRRYVAREPLEVPELPSPDAAG